MGRARRLTAEDYQQRQGIILSLEGPERFEPGDYLARGVQDEEWPIAEESFRTNCEPIGEADAEGFFPYHAKDSVREACQIFEPFTVQRGNGDILSGKAGDYLVRSGNRTAIVDQAIFLKSYRPIVESE
ncbi:hypothetical protein KTT_29190 [Tengunoibacter tsumagoiensis]|uniref:Uncharacterized protein n=2 Tax=Tengunoibacter tsumagoiensis TaxID=2014871 RepID=A0A402A1M3_9CHLR|nr:hypothetical protein KTT_29190 [Tengunoibacter tsumagoiensis]